MNPRDIAEALSKAGVDRLSPPAVAYLGERMGRSDLARCNLGGLRRISFGCARTIGDVVPGADPDASRWAYYRILDDGAHWIPGFKVASYNDKNALKITDAILRTKLADEPPNSVLVYRVWTDGAASSDPIVVVDNYEPGQRPEMARRLGIQGISDGGEPFDPAIIRGTVDEFDTFADLDAAARALVSVAYRAAPRAWGEVGEAELATLGSYPIHRIGAGNAETWRYVMMDTLADAEGDNTYRTIAENITDPTHHDTTIRVKLADDIAASNAGGKCVYVFRESSKGRSAVVINTCKAEVVPGLGTANVGSADDDRFAALNRGWESLLSAGIERKIPSIRKSVAMWTEFRDDWRSGNRRTDDLGDQEIILDRAKRAMADSGPAAVDLKPDDEPVPNPVIPAPVQAQRRDASRPMRHVESTTATTQPASYPTGIPPELEQTMRALVADWEGFDRAGVGSKVLPEFKPQAVDFRKTRDAWKAGTLDQATLDSAIQSATQVASQVRDALVKSGVVDPGLGPAAVKAAETAQAKPAEAATSWMDRIPALKWLNDPKGPKVRVEADSIVPAEWRAPIVLGVSALALYALTSRKHSRRTYASE